jgi:hypothetical protein
LYNGITRYSLLYENYASVQEKDEN